MFIKTDITTMI